MRTLATRWHAAKVPGPSGWAGPAAFAVTGASGGTGASTLCALIAGELAEMVGSAERRVAIVDAADGCDTPWPDWISPDLDPALGQEGLQVLDEVRVPLAGYPRPALLRCAGAARGLDGVAILTRTDGRGPDLAPDRFTAAFSVSVLDLGPRPTAELAARHRDAAGGLLLTVAGTADGIAAAIRSVRSWAAVGLPPSCIRPVVMSLRPGALGPRARARLALLDSTTAAITVVPFAPAIARRGLAEALAGGAIGAPTRIAVRRLLTSFAGVVPATAAGEGGSARAPAVPAQTVGTALEGNAP